MSLPSSRSTVVAASSCVLLVLACAGDRLIGPPDVLACVSGTVAAGQTVSGRVGAGSCVLWNDLERAVGPAESWTLRTEANTGYVVRMRPVPGEQGANTLRAGLHLLARTSDGDPYFATTRWSPFGPANGAGGRAEELVFASLAPETVSLRVQTRQFEDSGAYELEVTACPMAALTPDGRPRAVPFSDACSLHSVSATNPVPAAFLSLRAGESEALAITVARTAGTADLQLLVRGPGLDFRCVGSGCVAFTTASGSGPFTLPFVASRSGYFTAVVLQQTEGPLQASVTATSTP